MARKLMRAAFLILLGIAVIYASAPTLGKLVGIKIPDPMATFAERGVSEGACADDGVTLVIDFGTKTKRPPKVYCATHYGDVSTDNGWNIFVAAHRKVQGTANYPTGFVCRIDGFPSVRTENCRDTPSASAGHWSYFKATGAAGWAYSHVGAAQDSVTCGNWIGWRFVNADESMYAQPRIPAVPFVCR